MIDDVHQGNPDLVVMCNRKTVSDKYFPLVNKDQENSEKLAADIIISQKRMGNLPVYAVPFFPEDAILVTASFSGESIFIETIVFTAISSIVGSIIYLFIIILNLLHL